jgi:hypothetical protein
MLRKGTVGDYLIKLDNYVTGIENVEKRSNVVKNPGLLKKHR